MTVRIDLTARRVVAGHQIRGVLVVDNPGPAVNLTQDVPGPCRPAFAVILSRPGLRNAVGFSTVCALQSFPIAHGRTAIAFTVITSYAGCNPPGTPARRTTPTCLPTKGPPPLPAGTYSAVIEWSTPVPLPRPPAVPVVLT
jgi:hypothetical protein